MNHINEVFTDDEFDRLKNVKGDRTWRQAMLEEFGIKPRRSRIQSGSGE